MDFPDRLKDYQSRVQTALRQFVPDAQARPARLHEAMNYSLEAGGKRLRPVLVLAVNECLGGEQNKALAAAAAVECIHTYSLIHDDLPCMDDSDLRRGQPTCHKTFDEATALLAGDALLTLAFEILPSAYGNDPALACGLVRQLATAAGSQQLIGGQMEDLLSERGPRLEEKQAQATLSFIHLNKTARLIQASVAMGALVATGRIDTHVETFGRELGLAFQIVDDILDETSETAVLGKTAGLDARNETLTYTSLHGLDAARKQARTHTKTALAHLAECEGKTGFLVDLTRSLENRIS